MHAHDIDVRHQTEEVVRQVTAEADERKEKELKKAKDELAARLIEIEARTDYDALGKANLTRATTLAGEREQERLADRIDEERATAIQEAREDQRARIRAQRDRVRYLSVGIPACFIALIIVMVFIVRLARERADIPTSRRRRSA